MLRKLLIMNHYQLLKCRSTGHPCKNKDNQELQEYLSELIKAIREILDIGGDVLHKQIAEELQSVLDEIERRRNHSLVDLAIWIDCGLQICGVL